MNITTNNLTSKTTSSTVKQKISPPAEMIEAVQKRMGEKLHKDFASVSMNVNYIKNKIISNHNRLIAYEEKVSENQFLREKLKEVKQLVQEEEEDKAWKMIETATFHQVPILQNLLDKNAPLAIQLDYADMVAMKNKVELDKEFRLLQVASQNLSSVSLQASVGTASNRSAEEIRSQLESDIATYGSNEGRLSGKRVMDLISES